MSLVSDEELTEDGEVIEDFEGYDGSEIATPGIPTVKDLAIRRDDGTVDFYPHAGQWTAWTSRKRFIAVIAGTQSGKTSFGPHWLFKEIQERGPGDYMVVTPTFAILDKKALPEFLKVFGRWYGLGRYYVQKRCFVFSPEGCRRTFGHYDPETPTQVWFGYAEDPDSLESATIKAAWCDEAGQKKFKLGSWEAIRRRLSLAQGRALITTTPYDLGWLKQKLYDVWKEAKDAGPEALAKCDIDIVRFDSTENPNFAQAEFLAAQLTLPPWKFALFYRGIFTRPAGLIYGSFKDLPAGAGGHLIKPFPIPAHWKRFIGLDFGGVNTAAVKLAQRPGTKKYIVYATYHAGERTAKEHVRELLKGEPRGAVIKAVGGAKSEGQWRREFGKAGLIVAEPPVSDVEVGIERVYAAHADDSVLVFDTLGEYREEKMTYSRKVDEEGEPLEEIEAKNTFHIMDAERYVQALLRHGLQGAGGAVAGRSETIKRRLEGLR